jgi:hypothetical protein
MLWTNNADRADERRYGTQLKCAVLQQGCLVCIDTADIGIRKVVTHGFTYSPPRAHNATSLLVPSNISHGMELDTSQL